jgi:hypothetical protein
MSPGNWLLYIDRCSYRGAHKSLVRPGRKQATATKLLTFANHSKKFRILSVQPGLRGSNDLRDGRKMATFQLLFQSGRAKDLSAPLYTQGSMKYAQGLPSVGLNISSYCPASNVRIAYGQEH